MAKFTFKNKRQIIKKINTDIDKEIKKRQVREGLAGIYVEYVQSRKNIKAGKMTQAWRRYLEKHNKTSPSYVRSIINFTFTGELLKDLIKSVKIRKRGFVSDITLEHSDKKHRAYRTARKNRKKRSGKGVKTYSYRQIYNFIKEKNTRYDYLNWKVPKFVRRNMTAFIKKSVVQSYLKKNKRR